MKQLAYLLPKRVLYWAVIRVWANLTTTMFTDRVPEDVTVFDALKALSGKTGE